MQYIGKMYKMFQQSANGPNLCHQPKSSLISHLIDDHLLDAWLTIMSRQLVNISHRILIHRSYSTAEILLFMY